MEKHRTTHLMSLVLIVVFSAIFLVLFGRYAYIQATGNVQGVDLGDWAEQKRTSQYTLDAERGKIMDRNGMILAYDRPTYRLFAIIDPEYSQGLEEPKHVVDPQKTAEVLAPLLNMNEEDVYKQLNKKGPFQVEFGPNGRYLSQTVKEKIDELHLPGINFMKEAKRFYPNGVFASHVIGFAQNKEDKIEGVIGIEKQMDDLLSGKPGYISFKHDRFNVKLLNPEQVVKAPENGADIYLTIDQKIQTFLEDAMSQIESQYEPVKMTAIVMDPKTGEVLAMSNRPSFDPNKRENIDNWYNDVIAYPYEPGSTMKVFTVAAAMDAGVYDGQDTYQSGSYQISDRDRPIHDHYRPGWGEITYDEGIRRSSNVAAAKLVMEKLGPDRFLEYLKAFHFDQKTGIDLPGEVPGQILYNWPIEKATTAFGQGTTVTPLQQMMAATAVANDGKMVRPFVIRKVTDPKTGEVIKETNPEVVGEPIKKETAIRVRNLLETVITADDGTGKNYRLKNYTVAGKTGTAQLPDHENGGYLTGKDNYIFSFIGMAPKDDPKLLMYVSVKQPKLSEREFGSEPVSFIFKNVMENSLQYMNIRPSKDQKNIEISPYILPKMKGKSVTEVKALLSQEGLRVTIVGNGTKVADTSFKAGDEVVPNDHILIVTDGKKTMPDTSNWSLREVLTLGDMLNLKVEHMGDGYVTKQSIRPGAEIKSSSYLVVELQAPNLFKENSQKDKEQSETEQEVDDQFGDD